MRLSRRASRELGGLNMTAMIDIVFLLIIFFMTVSQITQNMAAEIRLPEVPAATDGQLTDPLELVIRRDGSLLAGGSPADADSLPGLIQSTARRAGLGPDRLDIQLRIDRETDSQAVNDVLRSLRRAGVRRVWSAVLVSPAPGDR